MIAFMAGVVIGYLIGVFVMAFRYEWRKLKERDDV